MTRRFGVIGKDIAYSMSPAIHEWIAKRHGLDMTYEILDVEASDLAVLVDGLREGLWHGFNVTKPYKRTIMPFLDRLTPVAKTLDAVNTVFVKDGDIMGDNTDPDGFKALLESAAITLEPDHVHVIGSGGAARAVVHVFEGMGIKPVVCSRSPERAGKIFPDVVGIDALKPLAGHVVVNCTPVGTAPDVDRSVLSEDIVKGAYVIDLVYDPPVTALMRHAGEGINGRIMLCVQALESAKRFHGIDAVFDLTMLELFEGGNP
jgi:shikimate dehydrogenase